MSTIRPLATIAVLAALGIFLALKINEQGPVALENGWETPSDASTDDALGEAPAFDPSEASLVPRSAPEAVAVPMGTPLPQGVLPPPPALPEPGTPEQHSLSHSSTTSSTISGRVPSLGNTTPDLASIPVPVTPVPAAVAVTPPPVSTPAAATPSVAVAVAVPENMPTAPPAVAPPSPPAVAPPASPSFAQPAPQNGFVAAWERVQEALGRNELTRAHLLASQWRGEPTLTDMQRTDVERLLNELAGTVVYSMEHRLEPPHQVRPGETLSSIAQQYEIPWQLLAKINGIATDDGVTPGQVLKVLRGPFEAEVVLTNNELVLMLDDRYAGRFAVQPEGAAAAPGRWQVENKQTDTGQQLVLRGDQGSSILLGAAQGVAVGHLGQLRVASVDAADLCDILSVGSTVTIRR